jgi:hypothetical protein
VDSRAQLDPDGAELVNADTGQLLYASLHHRRRVLAAATRSEFASESEQAALRCLYLVTRSLDPTGTGRAR